MRISDWSSDVCSSDLGASTEEQRLVQAHTPFAQGADHALVRGSRARGDQGRADRRILARRISRLQPVQRVEEAAKRRPEERRVGEECVSTCRYRGSPDHAKTKKLKYRENIYRN